MVMLIPLILVSILALYILRKKNLFKNTLFAIILINIIYIIIVHIIKDSFQELNYILGIGILIFINLLFIIISNKLSKNIKILILSSIIYFLIMCFVPVVKENGHEHYFYEDTSENTTEKGFFATDYKEVIKEFSQYYNIYNIPIFKLYNK